MRAIQAAGLRLVEARGYDEVTVQEIAEAADVSPSSIYRYFETKEGIFLWDEAESPLLAGIAARLTSDVPIEALRSAVHALVDARFERDGSRMLRRLRLIHAVPDLEAAARAEADRFRRALGEILASGTGRDVDDLRNQVAAAVAVGVLTAVIEGWLAGAGRRPFAEMLDEAFDIVADGLRS